MPTGHETKEKMLVCQQEMKRSRRDKDDTTPLGRFQDRLAAVDECYWSSSIFKQHQDATS